MQKIEFPRVNEREKKSKRFRQIYIGGVSLEKNYLILSYSPGLPDFSWYNIPKYEKCTK
jgi:hypothetical protein